MGLKRTKFERDADIRGDDPDSQTHPHCHIVLTNVSSSTKQHCAPRPRWNCLWRTENQVHGRPLAIMVIDGVIDGHRFMITWTLWFDFNIFQFDFWFDSLISAWSCLSPWPGSNQVQWWQPDSWLFSKWWQPASCKVALQAANNVFHLESVWKFQVLGRVNHGMVIWEGTGMARRPRHHLPPIAKHCNASSSNSRARFLSPQYHGSEHAPNQQNLKSIISMISKQTPRDLCWLWVVFCSNGFSLLVARQIAERENGGTRFFQLWGETEEAEMLNVRIEKVTTSCTGLDDSFFRE